MDSIRKCVIKVLNDNGVSIIPELDDEKILLDSIEFISVIVGLEEEFNIAITNYRAVCKYDFILSSLI